MTCNAHATSAARQPRLAYDYPACGLTFPKESGAIFATARTTSQRQFDAVMQLCQREILIAKRAKAKRQHKATSTYDAQIQAITHQMMKGAGYAESK